MLNGVSLHYVEVGNLGGADTFLGTIDFSMTTGDTVLGIGDVSSNNQSGDDHFVSTTASEAFVGLDGEDTFEFSLDADIGQDLIADLMIDSDILRFSGVEELDGTPGLTVEDLDAAGHTFGDDGQGNLEIEFENGGSLTLIGVNAAGIDSFVDLAATVNIDVM